MQELIDKLNDLIKTCIEQLDIYNQKISDLKEQKRIADLRDRSLADLKMDLESRQLAIEQNESKIMSHEKLAERHAELTDRIAEFESEKSQHDGKTKTVFDKIRDEHASIDIWKTKLQGMQDDLAKEKSEYKVKMLDEIYKEAMLRVKSST